MARWWSAGLVLVVACTGELAAPSNGGEGASTGAGAGAGTGSGAQGSGAASSTGFVAADSVARRLTRAELDNTLRDALGDETHPASQILADDAFTPFDNDYNEQRASRALIDSFEALAEDVAARVLGAERVATLVPCQPSGPDDAACFRQVIESVGRRLFRRPLAEEEIVAYLTLQAFAVEDNPHVDNDFYTAVDLFLRSVLQDPEFLYRIEVGTPTDTAGVFALNSYELATRVSYLLWGSTPDDTLLDAAAADALLDAEQRRLQVTRLLADDRARSQLHRFHAMWLGYRGVPHGAELVNAFNLETTRLIDRVVFDEPASYLDLFQSSQTYLTTFLADHYGLPAPAGGEGWVDYGDSGRAGILSHGSVLAAFSKFADTSPTQRGIFIQTRLMCNVIPPPPANVDVDQPPGEGGEAVCKYDRYAAHRDASLSCQSCHNQVDPVGFGLENYDIAGRWRDHDDGHPECTIEGQGELPGYGTFSGPAELGQRLLESGVLDDCVVRQFSSFALGRALADAEAVMVEELRSGFEGRGYAFADLLTSYAASSAFALRKEPAP